jgi:hypothetical protein
MKMLRNAYRLIREAQAVSNDLIEYMAFVLLMDSFSYASESQLEDARNNDEEDEKAQYIFDECHQPQQDILETIPAFLSEVGVDYKKHLPLEFVKKFVTEWEQEWGTENVKDYLDEFGKGGAFNAIMVGVGHGVSPFDDQDSSDFLEERGITDLDTYAGDGYVMSGMDLYDEVYNAVSAKSI